MPDYRSPEATAYRKLYKTGAWRKGRLVYLGQHPLCERCKAKGRITAATVVNHRQAHRGDVTLFFAWDNWQALCAPCHDGPTQSAERLGFSREVGLDGWPQDERHPVNGGNGAKRFGYSIPDGVQPSRIPVMLICGPPAAGKSTYVRAHAAKHDTVIDFDAIRKTVGGVKWDSDPAVNRRAFAYRDKMIRGLAAKRYGVAWLIVMAPSRAERQSWADALGWVTEVMINPGADVCLSQMAGDPDRSASADRQRAAIADWYEAHDATH